MFQDPYSSLNPRMRAGDIVAEPMRNYESARRRGQRASAWRSCSTRVGLRADQMIKYPYEFSGGQRQRLGIARALSVQPKLIVCDEPVSALDVSVQAQVINLLMDLQEEFGLSYLFIAHDLAVVEHISHRVAVMYLGKIVEIAPTPRALLASAASLHRGAARRRAGARPGRAPRQRRILGGDVPSPMQSAGRLPLPHALPVRRGALPRRRAAAEGSLAGPVGRVPSAPADRCCRARSGARMNAVPEARAFVNPAAAGADVPYGASGMPALDEAGFVVARHEISSWPGYAPTPLRALPGLAARLGLATLHYKDERGRFGLGSFKALGGAYAVANVLRRAVRAARGGAEVTSRELLAGACADVVRATTVTCATDGNHGRSVAWGAQLFRCRCVIFVHEHVSAGRREAIARYGAEVREVRGNYDDAVRHAAATAEAEGWTVVSDTSYPGYREIPLDVMHGYGVMAAEIAQQWRAGSTPTHVFAQAGVGALAAAVCASFWLHWGARRPRFVVVEPARADCVLRSLEAGRPVVVGGALDTVMAGLACGEVSELAWEVLREGADVAVELDDAWALQAMQTLASPAAGDPPIVAGETGAAGLAALLAAEAHADVRAALALDADSRVLLLGSEGDTDPEIYGRVVGRSAAEVLMNAGPRPNDEVQA